MIITKYVCDRCGHEQDTDEQMWAVGIMCDYRLSNSYARADVKHKAMWCRTCTDTLNLTPVQKAAIDAPEPAPPSIEDILREIVREEIAGAHA